MIAWSAVGPVFIGDSDGKADEMRTGGEKVAKELEQYNARQADSPWLVG